MRIQILLASIMLAACSAEAPKDGAAAGAATAGADAAKAAPATPSLAEIVGVAPSSAGATPAAATAGAAPKPAVNLGQRSLDYPNDLQMLMLSYHLRGIEPPLAKWAAGTYEVRTADEFSKAKVEKEAMDKLQTAYSYSADIGFLRMRTGGTLSEYDSTRQGFYVSAFEPGAAYSFNNYGGAYGISGSAPEQVALRIDNSLAAHLWPLGSEEARTVFEKNSKQRSVNIDMQLRITDVEADGQRVTIHAAVQSYTILPYYKDGQLGAVTVP